MKTLVERQAPIDRELANALIIATPETWSAAEMIVEREEDGGKEKMKIEILSPEGYRDLIGPTEEIYDGLYKLSDLFREYGELWKTVAYSVAMTSDGNWKYQVSFSY